MRVHETQFTQSSTESLGPCVGRWEASPTPITRRSTRRTNIVSAFPHFARRILHRTGPTFASKLLPSLKTVTYTKACTHGRHRHIIWHLCLLLLSEDDTVMNVTTLVRC